MKLPYTPAQVARSPRRRRDARCRTRLTGCRSSAARCTASSRRSARESATKSASRTCSSPAARCRSPSPTRCAICASASTLDAIDRGRRLSGRQMSSASRSASALLWAAAEDYDRGLCAIGPGIVGTGSKFGHGGLAAAEAANATVALDGAPILAVRASERDVPRPSPRCFPPRAISARPVPRRNNHPLAGRAYEAPPWLDRRVEVDVSGWEEACDGLPLAHMGRGPRQDPLFFAAAFAAGLVAADRSVL